MSSQGARHRGGEGMTVRNRSWRRTWLAPVAAATLLLAACGSEGEDRPNVDVIAGGGGTGSVSGEEPAVTLGAGYTASTNQDANLAIGLDLKDMRALMSAAARNESVDWAAVTAIYANGKNQLVNGSVRSLSSLAKGNANSVFPNGAAVYGRPEIVDGIIRDGLAGTGRAAGFSDNGRRQLVDKGVQVLMYALGQQRLAEATTAMSGNTTTAAATIDAAWAAMTGKPDSNGTQNNGLLATATTREEDFNLLGKVGPPLQVSLADALFAAQKNNRAAFDTSVSAARGYLNAIFYLSTLRNVKLLAADTTQANRELHFGEGWTYWQAIRATVGGASPAAAVTIEAALSRSPAEEFPAALANDIYAALNSAAVLQALGIPADVQVANP